MSYKVIQIKLNPSRRTREYCKFLQQESARVWNDTINYHFNHVRDNDGKWLNTTELKAKTSGGQYSLHSGSIQSVVEQFSDNRKTAKKLRESNPDIKYPYKTKKYFRVLWKGTGNAPAFKVKGRKIYLSNGKGNKPLKLNLPRSLASLQPVTVQLIWRNGYWLSLTIKTNSNKEAIGYGIAGCDMGEIHAMTLTDGYDALVISGRKLREVKQYRNKRVAQLQQAMSKCKKYSRRWRKLNWTKKRVMERTRRRIKDLNHKIACKAISFCLDHNVIDIAVGYLNGIAQNTKGRLSRKIRQKISQWEYYKQKQYLIDKGAKVGIKVIDVSEAYTSKTCPYCGAINPTNDRNYFCSNCNLKCHRDVIGACNILSMAYYGALVSDRMFRSPTTKYLRIPFTPKRVRRVKVKSSSSPDVGLASVPTDTHVAGNVL